MTERDRVFDAFRNCITEPKCRDCPWTECDTLKNRVVEIPIDLALAVMRMLKAQEQEIEDLKQEIEGHKDNLRETLDEMMRYADELKAHEPRLVESNDFENADDFNWLPAWCEERTGAGYWEMILPDALDEKDVRYWTCRPTQEQMEEIPWE